jgi:hypothetical protein
MLSAPAAIPATIEVSLPAGFTAAEATLVALIATRPSINADRPACSASAITGTRPAHDTRFSSSNNGTARDQPCGSFTVSAFSDRVNQDSTLPILPIQKALPRDHHAGLSTTRPRIEA